MKRFNFNDYISTAFILLMVVALISITGIFSRVDNLIYDLGQKLMQSPPPQDVVIVAIDENSLSQLGRWPWPRKTHATLIDILKKENAKVIGLDIIFAEPSKDDQASDLLLSKAIAKAGNVVLPVLLEATRVNGQLIETLPLPMLGEHAADLGRVHAVLDEDGIARSIYLYEGVGTPVWQHFSQAIINVALNQPSKNKAKAGQANAEQRFSLVREQQRKVSFIGPPGHFATLSYVQVLKGEFAKNAFKNKLVLVGATASGMNDLLSTPVSGLGQPMSGVEFHANVLQSVRQHHLTQTITPLLTACVMALLALLPLIWLPKLSALFGLLATLAYMIIITFLFAINPKIFNIWLPPSAALLPILIAYPVWSWRKLEAAQKFLDYELVYLKQNLVNMPKLNPGTSAFDQYDQFAARIAQVRTATEQLRFFQNDRKETLAFISHDLRAPLAAALMKIEQNSQLKESLQKPLAQALHLAEDFLQASRAELMDNESFKELDFAGLVHQSIDDAYEAALAKNIILVRNVVNGMVWVQGNFGLLHRAILNLILNAIKFGPANSEVHITLDSNLVFATLSVTDYGAGIPKSEQVHLFKRFTRVKGAKAEGTGLGLYFVQTVAEKHHGKVSVQSDVGEQTSFQLQLPINGLQLHENLD